MVFLICSEITKIIQNITIQETIHIQNNSYYTLVCTASIASCLPLELQMPQCHRSVGQTPGCLLESSSCWDRTVSRHDLFQHSGDWHVGTNEGVELLPQCGGEQPHGLWVGLRVQELDWAALLQWVHVATVNPLTAILSKLLVHICEHCIAGNFHGVKFSRLRSTFVLAK